MWLLHEIAAQREEKMKWKELSKKIDKEIKIGEEIPKIKAKQGARPTRPVTKKVGARIYMQTGAKDKKYTTKEMVRYAYETIQSGEPFTSAGLKSNFPREYNQGTCVFSMIGGILVFLGKAEYTPKIGYTLVNEK